MDSLSSRLFQELGLLKERFDKPIHLLVGVSGGLDSMALLHLLGKAITDDVSMSVVHVNHGLSRNAASWQNFVEGVCDDLSVDCYSAKVCISGNSNIEERARNQRLAVFASRAALLASSNVLPIVVLGHHASDMAEHFLLRLMRSAGPQGLQGSQIYERHHRGFVVWRPLLGVMREEILQFMTAARYNCIHDESNDDRGFDRNYLRHEIVPRLEQRWPGAAKSIRQSQAWCAESAMIARDLGEIDLKACECVIANVLPALNIKALLALPEYRVKNLIRLWLKRQGVDQLRGKVWWTLSEELGREHVAGAQICITVDFVRQLFLSISYGCLYLYKELKAPAHWSVDGGCMNLAPVGVSLVYGNNLDPIGYPYELQLRLPADFTQRFHLQEYQWRQAQSGEKMHPVTKPFPMAMRKLWQEWKIPRPLRHRWPVLVNRKNQIAFVPGVTIYGQVD